jgi:hypothetical protein
MSSNEATTSDGDIVATAGTYYRVTRYIITVVMLAMGLWFGYDGFINWPRQNREIAELEGQRAAALTAGDNEKAAKLLEDINKVGKHHSESDLRLQKILFFTLPPLAIAAIVRWIYISRGSYRLSGNVLHVPGHPPVPLDAITELDKRQWDRKGIAFISYDLGNGQTGKLKLDDFLYQREPTDEIYKRIEEHVAPSAVTEPQEQSAQ